MCSIIEHLWLQVSEQSEEKKKKLETYVCTYTQWRRKKREKKNCEKIRWKKRNIIKMDKQKSTVKNILQQTSQKNESVLRVGYTYIRY